MRVLIVDDEPVNRLVLYSDGVTECADGAKDQFGLARLEQVLAEKPAADVHESVAAVELALRAWRATDEFADDVTLLAIERRAA